MFSRRVLFLATFALLIRAPHGQGAQDFALHCGDTVHVPKEVVSQTPEAVQARARLQYYEEQLEELHRFSIAGEGMITARNDPSHLQLFRVFSQELAPVNDFLAGGDRVDRVEFTELRLHFATKDASIAFRLNGEEKVFALGAARFDAVIRRFESTLRYYAEFRRREVNSISFFSEAELKQVLENALTEVRSLAKDAVFGSKFYHVTRERKRLKSILEKGFTVTGGDAGTGVYAVFPPYVPKLQKVMKNLWSDSPKTLTLEFTVVPDAMILDVATARGLRAFEAWRRLNPKRYTRQFGDPLDGVDQYANDMKADIIIYDWDAGGMPAVLVRDPKKISEIRSYRLEKNAG